MKVSVFGTNKISKEDEDRVRIFWKIFLEKQDNITLLRGGGEGVTKILYEEHIKAGGESVIFKPWHILSEDLKYSTEHIHLRNRQIIDNSDLVIIIDLDNENKIMWIEKYCTINKIKQVTFKLKERTT
jgi:hypothetical protein